MLTTKLLQNSILIFGAWAKSHILLQIWIGLSLLIVGVSFACQGFWQVTVFSSIYALILIFVINLVRNVTQEQTRSDLINSHIKKDTKPSLKRSFKARFIIRSKSVMLPRRPTREVIWCGTLKLTWKDFPTLATSLVKKSRSKMCLQSHMSRYHRK